MPSNISWIPGAIAGFCSGIIGGLILEFAKRYIFVPKLILTCKTDGEEFTPTAVVPGPFTKKDGTEVSARYVRVAVTNESPTKTSARSCRAYLTGIKEFDSEGSLTDKRFAETLRLRWAYEGPDGELHGGIDIPNRVKLFFDVFSSQEACIWKGKNHNAQRILEVAARDAREAPELLKILKLKKSYRFSIMVTADGVDPTQADLDVRIGEQWNDIEVIDLKTRSWSGSAGL